MGSAACSRVQKPQYMEMGPLHEFKTDVSRRYGNHPHIQLPNKTRYTEPQLGQKEPASFVRQDAADDRILYPTTVRGGKEDEENKMTIDTDSPRIKEELMNISAASVDCDISAVLARLMASDDKEIKTLGKRLFTEAVLPATTRHLKLRTRSLPSQELESPDSRAPVFGNIGREYNKTQTQPDDNAKEYLQESSPSSEKIMTELQTEHEIQEVLEYSKLYLEKTLRESAIYSEKVKNMPPLSETLNMISLNNKGALRNSCRTPNNSISSTPEAYLEGEEETTSQTFENDFPDIQEEELGKISRNVDEFEQKINQTRIMIKHLRRESVNLLTKEMSNSDWEKESDTDKMTESLSYLEIEQKISQLEDERYELEKKRREALSSLQKKMLGNILGTKHKKLLSLVPIPVPKGIPELMLVDSQTPTSVERSTSTSSQLSRLSSASEAEVSDNDSPPRGAPKEEKPNEN